MSKTIYKELRMIDNKVLQIFNDEWAESPREWDNLGTMAIFHRRYDFGDKVNFSSDDFNSWTEMEKYLINDLDAAVILPIYMYDHSGITINTTGFSCPWDSGQVGFIYVTKQEVRDNYKVKRITNKLRDRVEKVLQDEVKTMDYYITGEVYGYQVIKRSLEEGQVREEILDSCSGFYGDDFEKNGIADYIDKNLLIDQL